MECEWHALRTGLDVPLVNTELVEPKHWVSVVLRTKPVRPFFQSIELESRRIVPGMAHKRINLAKATCAGHRIVFTVAFVVVQGAASEQAQVCSQKRPKPSAALTFR